MAATGSPAVMPMLPDNHIHLYVLSSLERDALGVLIA
jgi:hypothetical protein